MDWDAIVVGLGAMGSATLWRLAERGARVAGVDRYAPPHDRGSSHGDSRIIRSAYFEDPAYVPLVRSALTLWRELEARAGERLLTMTGAAMIGTPDSELVRGTLQAARAHGLAHEVLDATQAAARFGQHRLAGDDVVAYERDGGVLRPERCVAAMLRRAAALGATVSTERAVTGIESRGDTVHVQLDGADVLHAHHVVVCAGPWTSALLPDARVTLRVQRQVAAWLAVRDPSALAPEAFPVFIRQLSGERFVYGVPCLDGVSIKLAVHHEGAIVDPDAVQREISDADVQPLHDFAVECLHGVEPRTVRAVTCLYTNTPDGHFVIDRVPGRDRVTVVSACSGHGFKFAPAVGDIAADLALDGATTHDIARFSLARFA